MEEIIKTIIAFILYIIINGPWEIRSEYVVSPVRPLYECDPISRSVLLSVWYESCKYSCSPYKGMTTSQYELYKDERMSMGATAYLVHYMENQVSSHTDLFDNCNMFHSTVIKSPEDSDIPSLRDRVLQISEKYKNNTTLIIEDPLMPECSYFSDKYVSYMSIIAVKMVGRISIEGTDSPTVSIPALSVRMEVGEGYSRYGDSVVILNVTEKDVGSCSVRRYDDIVCVNYTKSSLLDCPQMGMTFSVTEGNYSHCGISNITAQGGGYYLSRSTSQYKGSLYSSISDSISGLSDPGVAYVISQINIAYGSFADAACESICDISDQLFSINERSSSVLETPIGPWLGWREPVSRLEHVFYVSSCRRVSNWKLDSPLSICPNTSGMSISNQEGEQELWDPRNTYFILGSSCSEYPPSDLHHNLVENRTVTIGFWGKELRANPPYITDVSWEDSSLKIFRSSKWIPFIHGISANATSDFYAMLCDINRYSKDMKMVKTLMDPKGLLTTMVGWYSSVVNGVSTAYRQISEGIFNVTLILGILLKIVPLFVIGIVTLLTWRLCGVLFFKPKRRVYNEHEYQRRRRRMENLGDRLIAVE